MKPSDTIMVSAAFIEEHNKLKEENERLQWYDRIRTEDMIKLEKKLAIAMEALDAVSGDYNEAENLGYYLRRIEEVTNE